MSTTETSDQPERSAKLVHDSANHDNGSPKVESDRATGSAGTPSTIPDVHYWLPVPQPDGRRHAFPGARRWNGDPTATAVCGVTVPMAQPSELDWVRCPTCPRCWIELVRKHVPEHAPDGDDTADEHGREQSEAVRG